MRYYMVTEVFFRQNTGDILFIRNFVLSRHMMTTITVSKSPLLYVEFKREKK